MNGGQLVVKFLGKQKVEKDFTANFKAIQILEDKWTKTSHKRNQRKTIFVLLVIKIVFQRGAQYVRNTERVPRAKHWDTQKKRYSVILDLGP